MIYYLNPSKGLAIRQFRTPGILSDFDIPVYEGQKVHFKDVLRQTIGNAFDSRGQEYMPNPVMMAKIDRKWKRKFKSAFKNKVLIIEQVDQYMAAKLMVDKYRSKIEVHADK